MIGLLAWELGLPAFSKNVGDIMNPKTFTFPIRILRVKGANYRNIVEEPNRKVIEAMIAGARELEKEGAKAITTSCGFSAIVQQALTESVNIPVFTSSLLQVPMILRIMPNNKEVGILTANKKALSKEHLRQVGIEKGMRILIKGLEDKESFAKTIGNPSVNVTMHQIRREVIEAARELVEQSQRLGAIVLECTNLPPFARSIQQETNLPIFDIITLANMMYQALTR